MNKHLFALLYMLGQVLLFPACNGIMGGIYDDPPTQNQASEVFVSYDAQQRRGRLLLDVVSYRHWTFVDLRQRNTQVVEIPQGLTQTWDGRSGISYMQVTWPSSFVRQQFIATDSVPCPQEWDFALHHYDVRSHRGAALETPYTSIDELLAKGDRKELLKEQFTPDVWSDHWAYQDLKGIFQYYIGYHNTEYNPVLSRWMDMRVQNPPPSYHPSGKVYLLRLSDGSVAALHFLNYMNAAGAKGYVSIDYLYPY